MPDTPMTSEEGNLKPDSEPPRLEGEGPCLEANSSGMPPDHPLYAIDPRIGEMERKARRSWYERQL